MIYNVGFFSGTELDRETQRDYLSKLEKLDILMMSRYLYTIGEEPVLLDKTYEQILEEPEYAYLKEIRYEEDELSPELKQHLINLGKYKEVIQDHDFKDKMRLADKFDTNKSMLCVTNVPEFQTKYVDHYLNEHTKYFQLSYKHDGWNISAYYLPGSTEVYLGHTRGRGDATARDTTDLLRKLLPKITVTHPTKVVLELVVKKSKLEYLRERYPDRKWVNSRNSVASFVAGGVKEEDYDCLDYFAFVYEDLGDTRGEVGSMFDVLKSKGFKTPNYVQFGPNIGDMVKYLKQFEDFYEHEYSKEYECDGMVMVAVTDKVHKETFSAYSAGMVAIKVGYFSSEILEAVIEEIYYGENKSSFTPKAKITPIRSRSGSMIEHVPLINLTGVMRDWLCPGDVIQIEYHSQQNVNYLAKVRGQQKPER